MACVVSTKRAEFSVAGVLAVVVLATLAALWPSLSSLWTYWGQIPTYQHAYLIAAISLAWLVVAAKPMRTDRAQPSLPGTTLLTIALLAWLVALRANIQIGHQLLFPVALWLAILASAGWPVARRVFAPVAFLYFSIPIWDYLVPGLQWMSVRATEGMLALVGVPAHVHENHVTIPEGSFKIIEGCSGERYFMVALAVAVLAAAINHMRDWRRLGFVVASGVLALVANWLRIVIVIYAGHVTNMQHYLVAKEHLTFGNAVFVVLLVAIFIMARVMTPAHAHTGTLAGPSPTGRSRPLNAVARWRALLPLPLLAIIFVLVQVRSFVPVAAPTLGAFPLAAGDWLGPLPANRSWAPVYVAPAEERRVAYTSGAGVVELYVNLYGEQRQDQELVYYGNTLLAPGAWTRTWPPVTGVMGGVLATVEAREPDGSQWLVAYTFKVGGWVTHNDLSSKLAYGIMSILHPVPSGVIALAVRCQENCEAARALVKSFWDDMSGSVLAMIPDGRAAS
jgi:EpsI family protein